MAKNAFMNQLKDIFRRGVRAGGLYYTFLMVLAIHNLYGWKAHAFDKIEAEMHRIDGEMHSDDLEWKTQQLVHYVLEIRGPDYLQRSDGFKC